METHDNSSTDRFDLEKDFANKKILFLNHMKECNKHKSDNISMIKCCLEYYTAYIHAQSNLEVNI